MSIWRLALALVVLGSGCGEHIIHGLDPSRPIASLDAEAQAEFCKDVEAYKARMFNDRRKCALALATGLGVEISFHAREGLGRLEPDALSAVCEELEARHCEDLSGVEEELAAGFGVTGCSVQRYVRDPECSATVADVVACFEERAEHAARVADSFDCSYEYYEIEYPAREQCERLNALCR